jgi:hypothetical protein
MPELNYYINSWYLSSIVLLYNIFYTNYDTILIKCKDFISLLDYNYITIFVIINIIGLYLLLNKLKFEINIKWTIKYD